jgi:predicted methyltransferase
MKSSHLAATLWYALASAPVLASAPTSAASPHPLSAALADPARPAQEVRLDALRKPAEVIAFAGLKSGDRVADFMSGNGYFTRIFSRVVGPTGRVYAFIPSQQLAHCSASETAGTKALGGDTRYRNVKVLIDPADHFAVPEPVDLVWTAQNYHDLHDAFMKPIDVAAMNAAVYRALKPGGVYLIIDHAAEAGSGLRDTERLHRIDPQSIRAEVTAAGFVFEGESNALRNPDDLHKLLVFDPAIRHRTDQVVLKFRKPD